MEEGECTQYTVRSQLLKLIKLLNLLLLVEKGGGGGAPEL